MQLVSLSFLIFVFVAITVYFLAPGKVKCLWLLAASCFFYYRLSGKLLILLVAVSLVTYVAGLLMGDADGVDKESEKKKRKGIMVAGVVILVLLLGFFKYTGFMLDTVKSLQAFLGLEQSGLVVSIALPVGISFYVFQAIGYIVDCYKGKIAVEKNYIKLALFISFFPNVMSGPIERAGNMLPQFSEPKAFSYDKMRDGLLLMLWGYFQKIIIADRLSVIVNSVYDSYESYSGTILFIAAVFYTFEIYCDFAGYSNIAVGASRIMGIDIMQNFRQPYLSTSIPEFWRKWHISLSSWLRDYLYIPLGGNRKGYARKLLNIMIVFAVSGLWHGAAWTFVVWGLLHGLYQVVGSIAGPSRDKLVEALKIDRQSFSHILLKTVVTFMLVNIGWVFFRAPSFSAAAHVLVHMWKPMFWVLTDGTLFTLGLSAADVRLLVLSLIALLVVDILNARGIVIRDLITKQSLWLRWVVYIAAFIFVVTCGIWGPGYDAASFIYSSF